ncbi:UbiC transcription regulator-associated [Cutibacterium acnes JCM 18920]|nr:UbiC transcription regulator-associated [Cutibacterium acnes JCM 18909]GAE81033.1 UbiC transcription regulator-associated [Cutibacterium acnes JCM 18920]
MDLAPSAEELRTTGFYDYLRSRDVVVAVGHQRFSARLALPDEARLLNEPPGAALLTMQRTACDESNRVIEFGQHVYRASIYAYENTVYA